MVRYFKTSPEAHTKLSFCSSNFDKFNSQPFWHSPSAVRVVCSNARDTGYTCIGYAIEHGGCILNGQWSAENSSHT